MPDFPGSFIEWIDVVMVKIISVIIAPEKIIGFPMSSRNETIRIDPPIIPKIPGVFPATFIVG